MNGVHGMLQLLEGTELDAEQKEYVTIGSSALQSLLTLINDILDFSKIEAGKLDIAQTPFALEELCRSIPAIFKEQSIAKRLDLSINIAADVPETVVGDPSRIRQVLLNVVGNAVKFTPDGGAIQLGAQLLPKGDIGPDGSPVLSSAGKPAGKAGQNKPWLEIFVQDSGYGIAKEDQERIFDEFYQVRNSSMKKPSGSGLGLPLARRFVAMHGGRIWMESEGLGKGSRFVARIPIGA